MRGGFATKDAADEWLRKNAPWAVYDGEVKVGTVPTAWEADLLIQTLPHGRKEQVAATDYGAYYDI